MRNPENFWDNLSKTYDGRAQRYDELFTKIIHNTNKHLEKTDTVLDYACGTGLASIPIANHVKKIKAIDISTGMISHAIQHASDKKTENIEFIQTSIFDDKFQKESFDAIMAFNILHLLNNIEDVILRINELLKQGGLFISATGCLGQKITFTNLLLYMNKLLGKPPYLRFYKISELEDLITQGNFRIIERETLYKKTSNHFIVAQKL